MTMLYAYSYISFPLLFSPLDIFLDFRERRKEKGERETETETETERETEREREINVREKYRSVVSSMCINQGSNLLNTN